MLFQTTRSKILPEASDHRVNGLLMKNPESRHAYFLNKNFVHMKVNVSVCLCSKLLALKDQ